MKQLLIKIILVCIIFISGCNRQVINELPDCGIQSEHKNSEVAIIPIKTANTYLIGDPIYFFIVLHEDVTFFAPVDFNIKIFQYDEVDEKWNAIGNPGLYFGKDHILDSNNNRMPFSVSPRLVNNVNEAKVYLCVSGVVKGEIQNVVGADYIFYLKER